MISELISPVIRELIWRGGLLIYRRWFRLEIKGRDRLPGRGAYLIVANHASHLDGPAIMAAQGIHFRHVYSLGATDYFFSSRLRRWIAHYALNLVSFDRYRIDLGAIKRCRRVSADGSKLLMFPEGTRSPDGSIQPFKPGFGFLARHLGLPVVPAYIDGAYQALPKGRIWPRRYPLTVSFGSPIDPSSYTTGPGERRVFERIAADVSRSIAELAAESKHYRPAGRDDVPPARAIGGSR